MVLRLVILKVRFASEVFFKTMQLCNKACATMCHILSVFVFISSLQVTELLCFVCTV